MRIIEGTPIVIVLQEPREKIWGVLREISSAGVFVRGLDINSFEDFVQAAIHDTPFYGIGDHFFPMWRIEKVTKDEPDGDIPSLEQQFEQRTELRITEFWQAI